MKKVVYTDSPGSFSRIPDEYTNFFLSFIKDFLQFISQNTLFITK